MDFLRVIVIILNGLFFVPSLFLVLTDGAFALIVGGFAALNLVFALPPRTGRFSLRGLEGEVNTALFFLAVAGNILLIVHVMLGLRRGEGLDILGAFLLALAVCSLLFLRTRRVVPVPGRPAEEDSGDAGGLPLLPPDPGAQGRAITLAVLNGVLVPVILPARGLQPGSGAALR